MRQKSVQMNRLLENILGFKFVIWVFNVKATTEWNVFLTLYFGFKLKWILYLNNIVVLLHDWHNEWTKKASQDNCYFLSIIHKINNINISG